MVSLTGCADPNGGSADAQPHAADGAALRAETTASPWSLRFVDAQGAVVLTEHPGTGAGPSGRLGFQTLGSAWWHATGAVSESRDGGIYDATLATTDPAGRRIAVRIAPDAEGVVRLSARVEGASTADVTALGIGFAAREGERERYLGFGERSNAVAQNGNTVENFVGEGPWPLEQRPFVYGFTPACCYRPRDDAASFPVPWLLSSAGYGVLVDSPETSNFRLGSDAADAWSVEVSGDTELALRVFAGPTPADALRRFTAATGRQPAPTAPWFLGVWIMPNNFDVEDLPAERARVRLLRDADVPVSAAETTMQYLPCGEVHGLREASQARVESFHAEGLAILAYLHSQICTEYAEVYDRFERNGWFIRNALGQPYVYRQFADRHPAGVIVSAVDFSAPGAAAAFGELIGEAVRDGYDGWMEDYGEYAPPDGVYANGEPGARMHNLYPTGYHCGAIEYSRGIDQPVAGFVRSGWTGTAACARLVWSGDPSARWDFDGLESALYNGLTMGLSGVGLWASELGGLFENGLDRLTPELLIRWTQFGAVSPWIKARKQSINLPPDPTLSRPQIWDPDVLPIFRRYAKLHTQLYPYLDAAVAEYRASGLPLMRHLALVYPQDASAVAKDDQFLFGPDLLAAPVIRPGQTTRALYLPQGTWVDWWRTLRYDEASGGFTLGAASLRAGGGDVELPAPLEELPLLVRAGAVLPLLPPEVDTLADYGAGVDLVRLADRRDRLNLLAFPRGGSVSRFYRDGALVSTEAPGRWTLAIRSSVERRYDLQASLATLNAPFHVCRVRRDGRPLPAGEWSYDPATRVLNARFALASGTLEFLGCPP
ncbi:MAG: glycoside hydrolase family 31 protein [Gammaproteobacteria bacterium]|nr:glycoside hydrolase family 31 protein [Gammaproteobacteria bacterium]